MSGTIDKQIVFKVINGKTFVGKYPDRSKVKYNAKQLEYRVIFARASKYASSVVKDPVKTTKYKAMGPASAYHAALREYMKEHSNIIPVEDHKPAENIRPAENINPTENSNQTENPNPTENINPIENSNPAENNPDQ